MLTYREADLACRGGLDLIISLTPDQAAALGVDAAELAEALDTVLVGLAALRTGQDPQVSPGLGRSFKDQPVSAEAVWDEWLIQDANALRNRLAGVLAAAIRAHARHGGTYSDLARVMGVVKGTAQRRRDKVTRSAPTSVEQWATSTPVSS